VGWSPDGRRLLCSLLRLPDRISIGLAFYSPESNTLSEPIRGVATHGLARLGGFLGDRLILLDNDGVHVIDPAAGADRLVVPTTDTGRYSYITCRDATMCYAARASDNADIWLRSEAEVGRP